MNQLPLFSAPVEKGSREWATFNPIDASASHTGMFRVLSPREADTPRYSNVIKIKRYHEPHLLFLKRA